mgnify:CR=1 FL=1
MADTNIKRSIEQKRAEFCLELVRAHGERELPWQENYVSQVKSLPATIYMCGLGQAMAFLLSKGSGVHEQLYNDITLWLCRDEGVFPAGKLMEALTTSSMETYILAQSEALALLVWLKKFAVAFLAGAKNG